MSSIIGGGRVCESHRLSLAFSLSPLFVFVECLPPQRRDGGCNRQMRSSLAGFEAEPTRQRVAAGWVPGTVVEVLI